MELKTIKAGSLEVAYMVTGASDGWPCVMCHGFPYDPHAFAEAAPRLAAAGAHVIIPYLRGYGPTRFFSRDREKYPPPASPSHPLLVRLVSLKGDRFMVLSDFSARIIAQLHQCRRAPRGHRIGRGMTMERPSVRDAQ